MSEPRNTNPGIESDAAANGARANAAEQRQRAMRVDVRIAHEAMEVVLPTNQQIGPWQGRAAHLLALAEKLRATGRHNPSLAEEVESLLEAVETQRRNLTDKKRDLPDDIARSSRVEDTSRALDSIASVLSRARELLRPNGKADRG